MQQNSATRNYFIRINQARGHSVSAMIAIKIRKRLSCKRVECMLKIMPIRDKRHTHRSLPLKHIRGWGIAVETTMAGLLLKGDLTTCSMNSFYKIQWERTIHIVLNKLIERFRALQKFHMRVATHLIFSHVTNVIWVDETSNYVGVMLKIACQSSLVEWHWQCAQSLTFFSRNKQHSIKWQTQCLYKCVTWIIYRDSKNMRGAYYKKTVCIWKCLVISVFTRILTRIRLWSSTPQEWAWFVIQRSHYRLISIGSCNHPMLSM